MKVPLILNPYAGRRQAVRHLPKLEQYFLKNGIEIERLETKGSGDATKLAKRYGKRYPTILCCGGDGTLSEVIRGIAQLDEPVDIGYLPAGTTNDFARSLRIPANLMEAAKIIVEHNTYPLDIGSFSRRYFTYVASFGAFTKTSYAAPQTAKNILGHFAYILEGIKEIPSIRPAHVWMKANGKVYEDDYILGAISNSTSIAGIIKLKDELVDYSDGLLEVLLIKVPQNPIDFTEIVIALRSKNYQNSRFVTFLQTERAEIYCEKPMAWSLDGEYAKGGRHVVVKNVPKAIRMIVGKNLEQEEEGSTLETTAE